MTLGAHLQAPGEGDTAGAGERPGVTQSDSPVAQRDIDTLMAESILVSVGGAHPHFFAKEDRSVGKYFAVLPPPD